MPTISGRILFDINRTANPPAGMSGIANVPVVLQNTATTEMLAVYTDINGNYSFINVPAGSYALTEAFRTPAIPSPGDFNSVAPGNPVSGVRPPISYTNNPPLDATDLDCTTPNTLLVTVSGADLTNLYICNGPVKYIPIESITDNCAVISPQNLLLSADRGTMGFFPKGTAANTGPEEEPFPGTVPDFVYVLPQITPAHAPEDGEYTVQNIMNNDNSNSIGAWWRIADHTTGNETGRMMVVNGYNPGAVFYTENVAVEPETHYLFSAWILNLFRARGYANPALGVQIIDQNGVKIYDATLGAEIPVNVVMPEWKQIGTVINSYNNTSLTVQFLSEGPAAIGNDYAIDDVALQEINVPIFIPRKMVSAGRILVGETVTYTVTLTNSCASPLLNVHFKDVLPDGLSFVENSVTINGNSVFGVDPATGFNVPNISGDSTAVITFDALAVFVPDINPAPNKAAMDYMYTPVIDGILGLYEVESNEVLLRIHPPQCHILSLALQRERNLQNPVGEDEIFSFDTPLISSDYIQYQADGTIAILKRGFYIVAWFISGMSGFAANGQSYAIKKYAYDSETWETVNNSTNQIKTSSTSGSAIINVTFDEIDEYGKAVIALFNTADAAINTTLFLPKAGIMVFGADFACVQERIQVINDDISDIDTRIGVIERFLYLSDVTEINSLTPELAGLGVAVIFIGYNYNFWGINALSANQVLNRGEQYYLITGSQYPALTAYQGESTIGTLWIEATSGAVSKYPLHFDGSGIYLIPHYDLNLGAGTKFLFTQELILI